MAGTATNGNSAVALAPPGITQQASYSGTPRGPDGTTYPDEYVQELRNPLMRMEKFEEMGASDDAVHTAIEARRQEINAANWVLSSEDETPAGVEILEFIEDNIYPVFDDLLRWLGGGALQYGFGAVEPVYQWSDQPIASAITRGKVVRATAGGKRRIYLAKLAHLRQTSVYTFKIAINGDLDFVQQHVFDGATFRQNPIPAEKILMWTYNRQGDDYWGVPPTRHCYKGWSFKTQIERLNLLHLDKFGVGTPVAEEGEGWTDLERNRLASFLKAWRAGTQNYILHPQGGKITIVGDDGKSTLNALEWVKYYNLAIAKTFLTQQTELGSTDTGARALGETFYQQLEGIVQADCEDLANLINNKLIGPLVRWNFGPQASYPMFAPSQRVRASTGVGQVLNQLASVKAIHFRPEDEVFLRDAMGLPSVELKILKQEATERDSQAAAAADALLKNTTGDPSGNAKVDATADPKDKTADAPLPTATMATRDITRVIQLGQLADGAPDPAVSGDTTWRTPEYSDWEYGILRPDVLGRDLDLQSTRLAGEVQDVLSTIDADLTDQVETLASKGAAVLSAGVRSIAVPDRLRAQLRKVLLAAAERARTYGGTSVMNELERQGGPGAIGPQRSPGMFARAIAKLRELVAGGNAPGDLHLAAEVDRAVEDEIDRREQSARSAALIALSQAAGSAASVLASVAATAAKSSLLSLSTGRTQSNVSSVVNTGFGIGRSQTAQGIAAPATSGGGAGDNRSGLRDADGNPIGIVGKVYSAVMDYGTCDECAKWDGAEFPINYPEDFTGVQAPNPRCAGGIGRCRCVFVYITDKESVPLVPAAKGPLPIRGSANA